MSSKKTGGSTTPESRASETDSAPQSPLNKQDAALLDGEDDTMSVE